MSEEKRFSLRITEELNDRISKNFYYWGDKSAFFIKCITQIVEIVEEYGVFVIYAIRDGKAKIKIQFDQEYLDKLQENVDEESTGTNKTIT